MASSRLFPLQRPLSLAQQQLAMSSLWPRFKCHISRGRLICRGPVQPTPLNSQYDIRVEHHLGRSPRVIVERPELERRSASPEKPIPHTYDEARPCLCFPGEWTPQDLVARTVVVWAHLWLFHYEIWHATGEWCGGGLHPKAGAREYAA